MSRKSNDLGELKELKKWGWGGSKSNPRSEGAQGTLTQRLRQLRKTRGHEPEAGLGMAGGGSLHPSPEVGAGAGALLPSPPPPFPSPHILGTGLSPVVQLSEILGNLATKLT